MLGLPAGFEQTALTAEASHRQFSRLRFSAATPGVTSLILMESPPALERNDAFVQLALAMRQAQIPVPSVLAAQMRQGWMLLSDVGGDDLFCAYQGPDKDNALAAAISLLPKIQALRSPALVDYSPELVRSELSIFSEWFVQQLLGAGDLPHNLAPVWVELERNFASQPKVGVHLDYHCRNLLFSPGQGLGVVDFQDARLGPYSYDLASLLRDCYYRLPEPEVNRWQATFVEQLNAAATPASRTPVSLQQFSQQMDLTALQRQLKAIGIFARLWLRDNKTTHLQHIAPTLAYATELAARYPATLVLANYLDSLAQATQDRLTQLSAAQA